MINHAAWLHLLGAAQAFDSNNTLNDTTFVNREATRIISVSQFGSGIWLDVPPDADLPYARQRSGAHAVALQRRSGLYLSAARAAYDSLQQAGETPDYLGDKLCNGGQHNTRHHATNRAWHRALSAVAIGPVLLGDKEQAEQYKQYNKGHVPDLVQPGATAWGTDWIGETKVASPFTATRHAGHGSRAGGGTPQDVGHAFAAGNTEERLHRAILGCRPRGRPQDGPFDHNTGRGHVAHHPGDYADALSPTKNNQVVPLITEVFGGLASRACATIKFGARRAGDKKRGRDGTKYSRFHRRNYLSHHLAAIVSAVVLTDASNIEDGITALKQRVTGLAPAGGA